MTYHFNIIHKALSLAKFGRAYTREKLHVSVTKGPDLSDWITIYYDDESVFIARQNGTDPRLNERTWKIEKHNQGDWEISLMNARKSKKFGTK